MKLFEAFFKSNNLLCKVIFFPAKIPFSKIQKKIGGKKITFQSIFLNNFEAFFLISFSPALLAHNRV
jgi:hypothetical protein